MCFAPQRRAHFQHLNFQKCSEREVISVFSLANVHPPLLRAYFLTLRSRKSLEKHGESQLYLFPHLRLLSSDSFSSLLFSSLTLPTSACPSIVGSLDSKLPSFMVNISLFDLTWAILSPTLLRVQGPKVVEWATTSAGQDFSDPQFLPRKYADYWWLLLDIYIIIYILYIYICSVYIYMFSIYINTYTHIYTWTNYCWIYHTGLDWDHGCSSQR